MIYQDYLIYAKNPEELYKRLKNSTKDAAIMMFQDYYNGHQWNFSTPNAQTRTTRSGRQMWKAFGKNPFLGFTKGEIKTWNIIKPAINIYAKYVRGEDTDEVKIVVKKTTEDGKETADKELSQIAMNMFNDLNVFVMEATKKASINSVIVTKFTPISSADDEEAKNEQEVLRIIRLENESDKLDATVEMIDARQIEPIYWNGEIRGMIRYYYIDSVIANNLYNRGLKKDAMYIEAWFVNDDGKVWLQKFINTVMVEDAEAPYQYIPYQLQVNGKRADDKCFDLNCLEDSNVEELIELQDDLNSFITDLGVIYRQVAIPMLKMTDEFIKAAKSKDIEKVKKNIQELTTYAGQILFAPVERMRADGVSDSQVRFIMDIREQYHIITNIPKSVFDSEGLANIAAETLEHLFESLSKVIAEKRTYVRKLIIANVKMYLISQNKYDNNTKIDVIFPNMFSSTAAGRVKIIMDAFAQNLLPIEYALERLLDEMGDSERYQEVYDWLVENVSEFKQAAEAKLAIETIKNAASKPDNTNVTLPNQQPTVNGNNNGNTGNNK